MKEIPLTKGKTALIDDADFESVSKINWYAAYRKGKWYAGGHIKGSKPYKHVLLHRFILNLGPGELADHKNGNGLDNQRHNIRKATKAQNGQNSLPTKGKLYSKYKGVCKNKTKSRPWVAYIRAEKDGKVRCVYLGSFETQEAAALAYNSAAIEKFGEFAYLNKIEHEPSPAG